MHILKGLVCLVLLTCLTACEKEQKDRSSLNLAAYEFIDEIGPFEVHKILQGHYLYVPSDCHRIWDGRTPVGNFVTANKVAVNLSTDICNDWTEDLVSLFQSYGYSSKSEIFKAPGFTLDYVRELPGYKQSYQRSLAYWEAPPGTTKCKGMPQTPQQYFPKLIVINDMFEVWNWHEKAKVNDPVNKAQALSKHPPEQRELMRRILEQTEREYGLRKPHCVPTPS